MATKPFYSGRISQELFDHIEQFRTKSGEGKTELLEEALAAYTGFQTKKAVNQSKLDDIYSRLKKIEGILNIDNNFIASDNTSDDGVYRPKLFDDNNKINTDNDSKEEEKESTITNDNNKIKFLKSNEVSELIGVSAPSLSQWKTKNLLPKVYENKKTNKTYEIDIDAEQSKPRQIVWRVRLVDNA